MDSITQPPTVEKKKRVTFTFSGQCHIQQASLKVLALQQPPPHLSRFSVYNLRGSKSFMKQTENNSTSKYYL
jgi:hypothetical protein